MVGEEKDCDKLVATMSQWNSMLTLVNDLKAQKRLLKELLDDANEERYGNQR